MKQKEQEYWDTLKKWEEQNPHVMTYINIYKDFSETTHPILTSLSGSFDDPLDVRKNKLPSVSFSCSLNLPTELQMTQAGCSELVNKYPESGKLYFGIVNEMRRRFKDAFPNTKGTNPPKAQIEQSIKTMYRSMIAIDTILLLCLGLFLSLHKLPAK